MPLCFWRRFIIAFVLLALIFNKAVRSLAARDLLAGTVIGTAFFITMACEMIALTQAASSLVSLLENCAIIFVPLLEILLYKKLPGKLTVISTGMAMLGVVLLALGQGELSGGFTWGLAAGLCYAAAIIVTERLSHGSTATLGIGIVQVGTMGVLSFLAMLLTETPQLPGAKPCQRRPRRIVLRRKPCHSRTFRRNCIRRTLWNT